MSHEPIISVSGLRGIVGESLTPELAYRYAAAFAETMPAGPMVVTRDGRASGPELLPAVVGGLSQGGSRPVHNGGIAATPTTGILVQELKCAGGIQISASHNPAEYNGLKTFCGEGRILPAAAGQQVLERFRQSPGETVDWSATPPATPIADPHAAHLARLTRIVDAATIRKRSFRVLVDANHGAGSSLAKQLLDHLGCEVQLLGGEPDGQFAHPPEPTAENLASVLAEVTTRRAHVGFCQDPDADRLAIIDQQGRYLGEEYTLAICANHVVRETPGPIVMNCSTSRVTEDVARKHHVPFYRTRVGEAHVVDRMLDVEAVIGGEGNGGVIDPRVGLVRDSFVGMALVLEAMATRELSPARLAGELPRYAIHKTKIELASEKFPDALAALEREFEKWSRVDRLDGLRLDWGNPDGSGSWLLVRASNTEPIVRLVAEAPTLDGAQLLCDEAKRVIRATCQPST